MGSNHVDLAQIIGTYAEAITSVQSGDIHLQHDNVKYIPAQKKHWARLSIREGESTIRTLGATDRRTIGVVIIQLFAPLDRGDGKLREYADEFKQAFQSVSLADGLWFREPNVNVIGRRGPWWQLNVECPFTSDYQ